jgi:hypothetical protein
LVPESTKWIEAHDIANIAAYSAETPENEEKDQIECTFKIFHTHGAEKVETTSIRQENWSPFRDYINELP